MAAKDNGVPPWENDVHIILAAKGGIGKTYIASLLAQYAANAGKPMQVLDLDQSNAMLARIPSLHAEKIDLLTDSRFDSVKFDAVVKRMATEPGPYLLDVGASTYQDVLRYLTKYKILGLLAAQKRRVLIHSVIVGGPEMPDTVSNFNDMAASVQGKQVIVWVNPLRGPVRSGGKDFHEMSVFENNTSKVLGLVELALPDEATMADLHQLALHGGTLLTANDVEELDFITKHRLGVHKDELFDNIAPLWRELDATNR